MSTLAEGMRAGAFFPGFLPSFTRLGYRVRATVWAQTLSRFDGQRWVITGASTGIGREIARRAALAGAEVLAIARSQPALAALAAECAAAARARRNLAPGTVRPLSLDLSSTAAIDRLLERELPAFGTVDVLVNNVGVLPERPALTAEGLDVAFATNLLNPWVLTRGALERGLLSSNAVVIDMSSGGMYNVALDIHRLEQARPWNGALLYAHHKRAQVALNAHLASTLQAAGSSVHAYVMHPGWVDTPGVEDSMPAFHALLKPLLRTPAQGADTALWLASRRPDPAPGRIWFDRAARPIHVFPGTRCGDSTEALLAHLEHRAAATRA
jgi:NAD(P)-dependent dehydrogenase (short-subunit alcohol dehydrogenase family)